MYNFKQFKKLCAVLSLSVLVSALPVYAASAKKSISYIDVNIDSNIALGMEYGSESIDVKTETGHVDLVEYYISDYNLKDTPKKTSSHSSDDDDEDDDDDDEEEEDSYDYGNKGAERPSGTWTETPPTLTIEFKVSDTEKYKFAIHNSTGYNITGSAAAKYKGTSGGSSTLQLQVTLETVKSGTYKLSGTYVTDDGETVVFPYSDENTYFTVRLYKGKEIYGVSKTELGEEDFDLTSMIYDAGTYKVQVRAYDKTTHQQTAWITLPESVKYTSSDVRLSKKELGTKLIKQNSDGTSSELKNNEIAPTGGNIHLKPTDAGSFEDHKYAWRWKEPDGSYALAKWHKYDDLWYYFDLSGYMVKGWQKINDKWYYFDDELGYAKSGWQHINNKWYYFDTADQSLLTNTVTPDGYTVNSNGEWVTSNVDMSTPADNIVK